MFGGGVCANNLFCQVCSAICKCGQMSLSIYVVARPISVSFLIRTSGKEYHHSQAGTSSRCPKMCSKDDLAMTIFHISWHYFP